MKLHSVILRNGFATIVRIGALFLVNKIFAVYVGPAGYATIAQFSNFLAICNSVSGGAVSVGVTKHTAQFLSDRARQENFWRINILYGLIMSSVLVFGIIIFREYLAVEVLGDDSLKYLFLIIALIVPLSALNTILLAILNGVKELNKIIFQSIITVIIGSINSIFLTYLMSIKGALISLIINQLISLFITVYFCKNFEWMAIRSFFGKIQISNFKLMLSLLAMSSTSMILGPLTQIIVRSYIVGEFGEVGAGNWQGVFKISEVYLSIFTITLGTYYLPRISEIKYAAELYDEVKKIYFWVLPLAIISALMIYFFKDIITVTLFSSEFNGMTSLFGWQLVGDVLKIGSWVLGFIMVGRGIVSWFIFIEFFTSALWIVLTITLTGFYGINGVTIAFAVNYGLYWIFLIFFFYKNKFHNI